MKSRLKIPIKKFGPAAFLLSLAGLAVLPLMPEVQLSLHNRIGLKLFASICYYEGIVSFLLLAPALVLGRFWSRLWMTGVAIVMGLATLIVGFYSFANGALWDIAAHTALLQTNGAETRGYLTTFASVGTLAWIGFLGAAFAICS